MEPTSVWKIEGIDKMWISQDGDEISLLLKNRDDLTKIILVGDAIKNHNDQFITTLRADLEEDRKEFRKLEKENKKLKQQLQKEEPRDNVNHPSHYETGKFECIEVMQEVFGINAVRDFCKSNAFKYIYRMDRKNGTEDVKKAIWYLNKYLELTEKEE